MGRNSAQLEALLLEAGTQGSARPRRARPLHWLRQCQLQTSEWSLHDPGRGAATLPVFPKARQHRLPTPGKLHLYSPPQNYPNWQLRAGKMQAATGDSAVQIRSNLARAGNSVLADREAGALGSAAATSPAAGALPRAEAQRRWPLRSLSGPPAPPALHTPFSPPLALSYCSRSRLLRCLPPPPLALSSLTFPRPCRRRRAPRQLGAHSRSRAASLAVPLSHLCTSGALRRELNDARGWGPSRSPGEMAGHWDIG